MEHQGAIYDVRERPDLWILPNRGHHHLQILMALLTKRGQFIQQSFPRLTVVGFVVHAEHSCPVAAGDAPEVVALENFEAKPLPPRVL